MNKSANVFDPIQDHLDQAVFNGTDLRNSVQKFVIRTYFRALDAYLGVQGTEWADLYFTGSLTTYQYSETSDADHSVFPDYDRIWKHLRIDPDTCRKQLIEMSIERLDNIFLPGTTHPIQYFIMPYGTMPHDVFKPGLRSAWSYFDHMWFVSPERERVHNVAQEYPEVYSRAAAVADKMSQMLDAGNFDAAKELWENVHAKRMLDQRAGLGDFSEGNIVLKWLLHEGLIDRLRNEAGMKIQTKVSTLWDPMDQERYDDGAAFAYSPTLDQLVLDQYHMDCINRLRGKLEHLEGPKGNWDETIKALNPVLGWYYRGLKKEREGDPTSATGYRVRFVEDGTIKAEFLSDLYSDIANTNPEDQQRAMKLLQEMYPSYNISMAELGDYAPRVQQKKRDSITAALPHLWEDRVTTKVIYDFDKDRIVLGTQATLPDLPGDNKIVGEYADGKVTLFEADKQWINPSYFRRLWHFSYPHKELKDLYYRRDGGDEYKLKSLPRKRKQDG